MTQPTARWLELLSLSCVASIACFVWTACGDDDAMTVDSGMNETDGGMSETDGGMAEIDAGPGPLAIAISADAVAYVGEDACVRLMHNGGVDAHVVVIWGDETREDATADTACHVYPYPGDFLVAATVEARGMVADDTALLPVVFRPSDPAPARSSPIAFDAARDHVWVVNPDADTIAVLDADPPTLLREIPVDAHPRTLAIIGGDVAVACQDAGTLVIFDAATFERRATVDLGAGSGPYGVVADPRGGRVWVTRTRAGDLVSVSLGTMPTLGPAVALGVDPRGLAMNGRAMILATRWRSDVLAAHVYAVDASDPLAPRSIGESILPRQTDLDSDTDNDGVLSFLNQIVFSPDGGRALLPALKANVVTGMHNTRTLLTTQTTARAVLAEVMVAPGAAAAPMDSYRFSFDDLDYASALVFSPIGNRIYVAMQGSEAVVALEAFSFTVTGSISDVGFAPEGLAIDPAGRLLYVQAFLSRSVRVYDVSDLSSAPAVYADVSTVATEPLAPNVLLGKQIFYRSRDPRMSRTSYLSCASCHLDGEGDNLVWDFTQRGEGLRNTIPLMGRAGLTDGALHWSANFDEVQDFEHDIRGGQGGTGFMSDADFHTGTRDTTLGDAKTGVSPELDALAAYVSTLTGFGVSPARRDGDVAWEASFARGETLFRSALAACATCHAGTHFTDSGFTSPAVPTLHDVGTITAASGGRLGGTLAGIDTPTLRGLWKSAPYLHDGSAATLREVLTTRNTADLHGQTSPLSPSELDDLIVFLSALDDRVP